MVAMVILAMIMTLFGAMFTSTSQAWLNGEANAERRRHVRAIADFIGTELQGALLPVHDTGGAGTGPAANLQFVINPPLSTLPAAYRHADAFFWQAPLARETSYGDIAAVGYFVKWENDAPLLCRYFVNPSVKTDGVLQPNPLFQIYQNEAPDRWLSPAVVDAVVQPANELAGFKGLFAENVLGIWVRCYGLDGRELPRDFDSRTGYDCTFASASGPVVEKRRLPATVSLSLAQVDSRHAFRVKEVASALRALSQDSGTRDAAQFLKNLQLAAKDRPDLSALLPSVRIYTTQIQLQNAR
jgi:hypothetical protein